MNKKYNFLEYLNDAYKNRKAIPAFDYFSLYDAQIIIEEAERANTPVILMESFPEFFTPRIWLSFIQEMADNAKIPVFTHIDHAETVEYCFDAIDAGFDSVMIDASLDPLEENIRKTKLVVDYAHAHGVAVESEAGQIKNKENGALTEGEFLVYPPDAKRLVDETGCDFLAVGIGNQHGIYVGEPNIHLELLEEVNDLLQVPLVMHGGSGLPKETIQETIRRGITKVNVYTDIAGAYTRALRDDLNAQGEYPMFMKSVKKAQEGMRSEIRRWINTCLFIDE